MPSLQNFEGQGKVRGVNKQSKSGMMHVNQSSALILACLLSLSHQAVLLHKQSEDGRVSSCVSQEVLFGLHQARVS